MMGGAKRSKISFSKNKRAAKKKSLLILRLAASFVFLFCCEAVRRPLKNFYSSPKVSCVSRCLFFPPFFIFVEFRLIIGLLLQLPNTKLPREIYVKAENSGEINVFLCHDQSPENSPMASGDGYVRSSTGAGAGAGGSGVRTATSTRLHPLTNQRLQDPLFNNIDAMSTKGLGELQDQVIQSCSLIFLIIFPIIILLIFFAFCL